MQQMTLVEIFSTESKAFCFHTFKGPRSVMQAEMLCERLPRKHGHLKATIVKIVEPT